MCQSLDELIKSSSLHLNQIVIWTSVWKYYAAKVNLKMNLACSARLYVWSDFPYKLKRKKMNLEKNKTEFGNKSNGFHRALQT